jgi:hypothetical protein
MPSSHVGLVDALGQSNPGSRGKTANRKAAFTKARRFNDKILQQMCFRCIIRVMKWSCRAQRGRVQLDLPRSRTEVDVDLHTRYLDSFDA